MIGSSKISSGESSLSGSSSSESGSSSSESCAWTISDISYIADDEMVFVINNTGGVGITFTSVDAAVAPLAVITPSLPFTVAVGALQLVTVTATGTDLRGTAFTATGSCGTSGGTFPYTA